MHKNDNWGFEFRGSSIAFNAMLSKWVLLAFELGEFNLKIFLRQRISRSSPLKHQKWILDL
jgi:hypothetical protein